MSLDDYWWWGPPRRLRWSSVKFMGVGEDSGHKFQWELAKEVRTSEANSTMRAIELGWWDNQFHRQTKATGDGSKREKIEMEGVLVTSYVVVRVAGSLPAWRQVQHGSSWVSTRMEMAQEGDTIRWQHAEIDWTCPIHCSWSLDFTYNHINHLTWKLIIYLRSANFVSCQRFKKSWAKVRPTSLNCIESIDF